MHTSLEKTSTGGGWFVRPGQPADCLAVHELIVELAIYEQEPDAVVVTPEDLKADGFGPSPFSICSSQRMSAMAR